MLRLGSTAHYAIHQSLDERCFYLNLEQKVIRASFCELLALRQKVNDISLEALLYPDLGEHDFKILTFCNNQHLFVLNIQEVLELKTLIQNSFAALGLSLSVVPITTY